MDQLAAQFNKVYANLPLGMRDEVALVLDDQPISWQAAYIEVYNETDIAKRILKELDELKLI